MGGTRCLIGGWLQSDRDVQVCWGQPEGRRGQFLRLRVYVLTCDDEALVVFQSFSEEAWYDELRVDEEADLLLDQAQTCHPSAHHPVRKVHLRHTQTNTERNTHTSATKQPCSGGLKRVRNFTLEHGVKWRYGTEIGDTRLTILTVTCKPGCFVTSCMSPEMTSFGNGQS